MRDTQLAQTAFEERTNEIEDEKIHFVDAQAKR